jgi:AMP deaminase
VKKSRVSDIRVAYRYETYHTELNFLDDLLGDSMPRALQMLEKEVDIYEEKTGTKVEMPTDGLDGEEVETVESLQAQIQEATMQIKRGKIQMQSLAEANIQLTKEIQRILKSSREPMKLSANLNDLSQFLQSQ